MNETGHTPAIVAVLFIGLILWRMYMRVRRTVGRQELTPWRPRVVAILYPVIAALLGFAASTQPLALAALVGGIAAGFALGLYGLKLTRFEATPQGLYYTPSTHIGLALTLLLVGRLVYRMFMVTTGMGPYGQPAPGQAIVQPWTLLVVGPLVGYYTTYYMGLLRWRARVIESQTALTQPPP